MYDRASLIDLAGRVAAHLRTKGIDVVVVGGSAVTAHVPNVYTSHDIDFGVLTGDSLREISQALAEIGFKKRGREFVAEGAAYSVDIVAGVPLIDQEPIYDYAVLETSAGPLKVYHIEDAISDRIAAFVHWSDSESLDVAERATSASRITIDERRFTNAMARLKPQGTDAELRLKLAQQRIARARST